jgi:hypothetical protein
MARIGNITSIVEVKNKLSSLQQEGLIKEWELPYENLLTRLGAAVFFVTLSAGTDPEAIWQQLDLFPGFSYKENVEKLISQLTWRIEFNPDSTL